jgi:hypothetical protein
MEGQGPGAGIHVSQRLDRVHDQIENDLLQLDTVPPHDWQVASEVRSQRDVTSRQLSAHQRDDVLDDRGEIQRCELDWTLPHQSSNPLDDVVRSLPIVGDVLEHFAKLIRVERAGGDPTQARLRIGDDRGQRLIDFVNDRGGQLSHGRDPRGMGEIRLDPASDALVCRHSSTSAATTVASKTPTIPPTPYAAEIRSTARPSRAISGRRRIGATGARAIRPGRRSVPIVMASRAAVAWPC